MTSYFLKHWKKIFFWKFSNGVWSIYKRAFNQIKIVQLKRVNNTIKANAISISITLFYSILTSNSTFQFSDKKSVWGTLKTSKQFLRVNTDHSLQKRRWNTLWYNAPFWWIWAGSYLLRFIPEILKELL